MAVFRLIAPFAIVVEVIVADHIARNVFCGDGAVFLHVALGGPAIETVGTGSLLNAVLNVFCAVEFGALTGMNFVSLATGGDFAFAANHGHAGRVAVIIHVDAKGACLFDREYKIRSVHFVEVALAKFANAEIDATFREAHLRDSLIEIEEGKSGHAAQVDGGHTSLQFGAGILVDPDLVADGHGAVFRGATPIALPAGLQRDGTIDIADAGNARGRIFLFVRSPLRSRKTQKTG